MDGWPFIGPVIMVINKFIKLLIENNVKIDRKTIHGIHDSDELKGKTTKEIAMKMGYKDISKIIKKKNFVDRTKKPFNILKEAGKTIPFTLLYRVHLNNF